MPEKPQYSIFPTFEDLSPYVGYMPFAPLSTYSNFVRFDQTAPQVVNADTNAGHALQVPAVDNAFLTNGRFNANIQGNNNISAPLFIDNSGAQGGTNNLSNYFTIVSDEETVELLKKNKELTDKILDLSTDAEKNEGEIRRLKEEKDELIAEIESHSDDAELIKSLKNEKESLNADLEARGVRISELEKSNKALQKSSDFQKKKIGFLSSQILPFGVAIPGASGAEQYTAYLNGLGPAMPAPRTEQEQRAVESQMIMQRHGPFRMYDEGTETFLRDYTDPENYSDRYNRLAERRERGHDRMVGLLNAGMITDTDLGWYDAKTQEKLANQYRADNVDPDWLAQQQQAAKDTREANRYAMRQQRAENREDIREARQETRDANRMARRHALGGTLLSDYNSAGWRFDGEEDSMNFTRFGKFLRGLTGDNPVFNLMHRVYDERIVGFANKPEDNKQEWEKDAWGLQKKWVERIDSARKGDNNSKLRDMWVKVGEWVDNGLTTEGYNALKDEIAKSGLYDVQKDSIVEGIDKAKEWYENNIVGKGHDFGYLLRSFEKYYGHPYNSALSQNGASGQTGQGAGDAEKDAGSEIKIVSEPLEDEAGGNAGSETETAETQTGASSFIPYDNSDVDFNALYDPEGEYMKAIKWIESNPDSELARDLLADINGGKYGPLNGHKIETGNFRQLATDSKRGPVHNAVMGLIGGESPLWKDAKYKYEAAPWGNVVVKDEAADGKDEEAAGGDGTETPEEKAAREAAEREAALKAQEKGDETQRKLPTWMRYAPIAASAMGLLNPQLYRKDYTNANFLRDMANSLPDRKVRFRENLAKMRYTPVDRNMLTNTQNANMAAAMRGASGSNAGNAMAYNLALLKTGNEAVGSQYAQTATANNQMYNQAMQFNNAVNQANAQGNFTAQTTNAQLGQQRDAMRNSLMSQYVQYREAADNGRNRALSTQLNSLSNNLGELGKEFYNRNAVAGLPFVYGTDLNGNPYYRGQQTGSGFQVPFELFPQTQTSQAQTQTAPALTEEQRTYMSSMPGLTDEQKKFYNISAYGSFLRPYYRRA